MQTYSYNLSDRHLLFLYGICVARLRIIPICLSDYYGVIIYSFDHSLTIYENHRKIDNGNGHCIL